MKNNSRDTARWTHGSVSCMNQNTRRVPSGRKDFLEKNSRFFTGYALSETMSSVPSDTEEQEQPGLREMCRRDQTNIRTAVHEMRQAGKNGRRVLRRLQEKSSLFYGGQKYIFVWRDLAPVAGLSITDAGNTAIFTRKP